MSDSSKTSGTACFQYWICACRYGLLILGLQAFIVYKCVTRFLTYISLPWPQVTTMTLYVISMFAIAKEWRGHNEKKLLNFSGTTAISWVEPLRWSCWRWSCSSSLLLHLFYVQGLHHTRVLKTRQIEKKRKRPLSLLIWSFLYSRFRHFQCPKRKSKTTSEYKRTPN